MINSYIWKEIVIIGNFIHSKIHCSATSLRRLWGQLKVFTGSSVYVNQSGKKLGFPDPLRAFPGFGGLGGLRLLSGLNCAVNLKLFDFLI